MTDYYLVSPDQTTWNTAKLTVHDCWLDEIGPIVTTPAILDAQGNVITPAVVDNNYHVNVRTWDAAGDAVVAAILAGGQITSITPATPYRVWC